MSTDTGVPGRIRWVTPPARDVGLAAALFLVDVLLFSSITPTAFMLALVGFAPLAWRSVAPIPVFFAVWFFALTSALVIPELRPVLGLLVATYTMASRTDRKAALLAAVLAVPTGMLIAVRAENHDNPDLTVWASFIVAVVAGLLTAAPWFLGRWVWINHRKVASLELARQREAEQARIDERKQIALELHDIVSHSVTVMVLQADGARAVLDTDTTAVDKALGHISEVGRSSIGELRRLLGLLTDGTLSPTLGDRGGLDDIPALLAEAEQTGLQVRLDVSGRRPAVPDSFGRTVHRIVKESLANARKHGGEGNQVTIQLFWSESVLVLTIADTGSGGPVDSSALSTGHGLAGLQERVKASDGRLEATPNPGGHGFTITTTLPIPVTPAPSAHRIGT